jgi:ferredoxin, 2Fe-2S
VTQVRVEPLGVVFELQPDETLMAAAQRLGYYWPTICKGNAQCNRCVVRVVEDQGFAPMSVTERAGLQNVRWKAHGEDPAERLACQLRVASDASGVSIVEKRGVKTPEELTGH